MATNQSHPSYIPPSSPRVQRSQIPQQLPIKRLTADRHLCLIKRILHDVIRVELVYLPQRRVYIRLLRFREKQELRPRERGEALEAEVVGLEHFDAGGGIGALARSVGGAGGGRRVGEGVEAGAYGVDSGGQDG